MSIKVYIKSVYGEDKVYPKCDMAKIFAKIAGTTTLTHWTISKVKELGYTVHVESEHQAVL